MNATKSCDLDDFCQSYGRRDAKARPGSIAMWQDERLRVDPGARPGTTHHIPSPGRLAPRWDGLVSPRSEAGFLPPKPWLCGLLLS